MDSDLCSRYADEAAAFVLGDVAAERRAEVVAHLDRCAACRREVTTLAATLDSITAATKPVAPRAGFVDRVLAAADAAGLTAPPSADAGGRFVGRGPRHPRRRPTRTVRPPGRAARTTGMTLMTVDPYGSAPRRSEPPVRARPVAVVLRRRRTLAALTGVTVVLALLGLAFGTWALVGPAIAVAALDAAYLSLVITVAHTKAREDLAGGHGTEWVPDEAYWRELQREIVPIPADEPLDVPVVAVRNTTLVRFVVAYFLGWALTPVVAVIRLRRGGLAGVEQSPLLGSIVALQRRGRAQSLRLLVAGATTVAVAGGGAATVLAAPGLAAAAPAPTYTVHPGDTLSGIADRFGVPTGLLAQINGIADPNLIVSGEAIRLSSGAVEPGGAAVGAGRYAVAPGDTLWSIAERFGTTASVLAALNHIGDPNLILVGQTLRVPTGAGSAGPAPAPTVPSTRTYTVAPGDTLGSIAERFGTTASVLAALNHIGDPNLVYEGQVLVVSGPPGAPPAPAAAAPPPVSPPSGETHPAPPATTVSAPVSSHYVNPFAFGSWSPSRIDEGVDWIPNSVSPVVAIGDGVITYSSTRSGWPAGGFIAYRLTTGSHAGLYVYVAEHITDLLPAGTVVSAGQRIATALPGYPWTEWGWGSPVGQEPAPSARYNGLPDGTATPGGKAFARFLMSLGVPGVPDPGPGPTSP